MSDLEQALVKQLELAPETEILGVVGPGGVCGVGSGSSGDDIHWSVRIKLCGWKPLGSGFRKSEMTVRKLVPESAVHDFMGVINSYDVVRVRVRWLEDNLFGSPQALLAEFVGQDDSDCELNSYAIELQKPVTFTDPQFGVFTLDRQLNCYEAEPDWCGGSIRLRIDAGVPEEMAKSLAVARQLWAAQEEWQVRTANRATHELLGLKNDVWLDENEQAVSAREFVRRMELESISVQTDGTFEFWHDDGDLFWGHSIMVSGNLADGPTDAGIHG